MNNLPEIARKAWDNRKGPFVFTTVNKHGTPNSIYATSVSLFKENQILVANNFFSKTLENIFSGSTGVILFITNEDMSYQIKGDVSYFTEGEQFDVMKNKVSAHRNGVFNRYLFISVGVIANPFCELHFLFRNCF